MTEIDVADVPPTKDVSWQRVPSRLGYLITAGERNSIRDRILVAYDEDQRGWYDVNHPEVGIYYEGSPQAANVEPAVVLDLAEFGNLSVPYIVRTLERLAESEDGGTRLTVNGNLLRTIAGAFAEVKPSVPVEPTDPAIRAVDRYNVRWARMGEPNGMGSGNWASDAGVARSTWASLWVERGPLKWQGAPE